MRHTRKIISILLISLMLAVVIKFVDQHRKIEDNKVYSNFLCMTSKLNVQIGDFRDVSENIRTFLHNFGLKNSSHRLQVGDRIFHQADSFPAAYDTYDCVVDGRPDIAFSFILEHPVIWNLDLAKLLTLCLSFCILIFLSFKGFTHKYQKVIRTKILERLKSEFNLTNQEQQANGEFSYFMKVLSPFVDFKNIKEDVDSLKNTIDKQGAKLVQTQVRQALLEKEISQNKEFSEKVDIFIHDIKSPIGLIGALQSASADENQKAYLQRANVRLDNLLKSLTHVKSQYRYEVDEWLSIQKISEIAKGIIFEKRKTHPSLDMKLSVTELPDSALQGMVISESDLVPHLSNLLNNSIEADSKTIELKLYIEGTNFIFLISDDGKGIPVGILNKVFGKGFSAGKTGGSGLGLYSLQKYLNIIDGDVFIKSVVDQGTEIKVVLPLKRAQNFNPK